MALLLIKKIGVRKSLKGNRDSIALFKCTICNQEVERTLSSIRYKSCGCYQHKHEGCKKRDVKMEKNPKWKGGVIYDKDGYKLIKNHEHESSNSHGYVREHVLICEAILGKKIPSKAMVHHIDGNKSNNNNNNLVLCENDEYHKLLHIRTNSMKATGSPNNYKCSTCQQWKTTDNFYKSTFKNRGYMLCKSCVSINNKNRRLLKNA